MAYVVMALYSYGLYSYGLYGHGSYSYGAGYSWIFIDVDGCRSCWTDIYLYIVTDIHRY